MIEILSLVFFIIGAAFVSLFFYSLVKQRNRDAALFSLMCLSLAIYIIGYGLELRSQNVEDIIFFSKMQYMGIPYMSTFWFLFSYKFYFNKNVSLRINSMLFIIPTLTLFFCVTNEYHHFFYADVETVKYEGFILAKITKGPWYFISIIYSYVLLVSGILVFGINWRKFGYKMYSKPFWMFFGTIWPLITNCAYIIGFSPLGIDITPFGLSILAACYFIALFRFDFLELKEIITSVTFSKISEGIIVIDDKDRIIDFNNTSEKIFSWIDTKNIGRNINEFDEGRKIKESHCNEIEIISEDTQKCYEFHETVLKEKNKVLGSVYIFNDITKQKDVIRKLDNLASYDEMTQIYNRRRLMEEAEKELLKAKRYGEELSVFIFDIDRFKEVNDKYGHLVGDEVLKGVVKASKDRIRNTDICGRYGGEEFLIICPNTSRENALKIAEDIRQAIENLEIEFDQQKIRVTISGGIASTISCNEKTTIQQIIKEADKALYCAKNSGRNKVRDSIPIIING